jgi:Asp-tRNA(Asn)/Glu-tRNA(Gln) amidotransferase C subunit
MIKFDLDNIDINELKSKHMQRLFKLYKLGGKGQEPLSQDEVYSEEDAINDKTLDSKDIVVETKFEEVVKKFYEVNKIKNVEVEPNTDPQDNIYLSIVENIKRREDSGQIEVDKLIEDPTIKANLTRYAGLKKKESQNILKAEENVAEEMEILYNEFKKLPEVDVEKYSSIEEQIDQRAANDIRLKELSHTPIAILSKEYIDKQFKDDIINITSSLSNNSILPLTMKKIDFEDTSNANNQLYKLNLAYTVNINGTNKDIRFSVNIPKIIDNHFLYLNGNR